MGLQSGLEVSVSSATTSDHLQLPDNGDYILTFRSGGAFILDLQEDLDATSFKDAYYDATNKVTIDSSTGPQSVRVAGGRCYRMDVGTYNSVITMKARRVGP
jgi:hypothetical protein